jgi:hypothetical protein
MLPVPLLNYVRVPALGSGLMLLLLPGMIVQGRAGYGVTGHWPALARQLRSVADVGEFLVEAA